MSVSTDMKPLPRVSAHNAPYFEAAKRGKLVLQHCPECGTWVYYPRVACPNCLHTGPMEWKEASGTGVVHSFALVHRPQHPAFFSEVPIPLVAVRLDEGPIMISAMVGCDPASIHIGMRVKAVFEHLTEEVAIPRFAPA